MPRDADAVLLQISDELTRLYKEMTGRGPATARAYRPADRVILVVLENSFTPAEQRLRELGEFDRLRDMRTFFQYATEREFVEVVERLTGRTVRAFVSGLDARQDVSVEVFMLEPDPDEA